MQKKQPNKNRACCADGCRVPSRSKGYCARHYKQLLRHGRLTPDREQRKGCRINGCGNDHKARGYCSKHYKELMARGCISNNGKIKEPFCWVSSCQNDPGERGLCDEHYAHYHDMYIENGYTWSQVDRIIVLENQEMLFNRNRIILIRKCHQKLLDDLDTESYDDSTIPSDVLDDMVDDEAKAPSPFNDIEENIWPEAEEYESGYIREEELQNLC